MVVSIFYPLMQLFRDSLRSMKLRLKPDEVKNYFRNWSISLIIVFVWLCWWLLFPEPEMLLPISYENGVVYLNFEEDSKGEPICETPTRLFIAIESGAADREIRNAARNTWLQWAVEGNGANYEGEKLAQYLFFTTDTVDTRSEALEYDDMVIVTERGMPEEEEVLVREYEAKKGRGQLSQSASNSRLSKKETVVVGPKATAKSTTIVVPKRKEAGSEVGKRHPKLCKEDMVQWCSHVQVGAGRMDECMFLHRDSLSSACRHDLAEFEAATREVKRDWGRRLLGWWSVKLFGEEEGAAKEVNASDISTSFMSPTDITWKSSFSEEEEEGIFSSLSFRGRSRLPDRVEYEKLPWCDPPRVTGGCLMRAYESPSSPSLTSSLHTFRFHSQAQISKPSSRPGMAGGGKHHDGRLYSPKLISLFRFHMLEFLAEHHSFSFLLMLDLTPPQGTASGFLCLSSVVTELKSRPHERFLWRGKACGASNRDDSFLLMSRDVVELLRGAARRSGANMLILDRMLFRLPLTVLSDENRLRSSAQVDWSAYQFRALVKGKSSLPHLCEDLIWITGVATNNKDNKNEPKKKKKNKTKTDDQDDAQYMLDQDSATMNKIFKAHKRFSTPSHWNRKPPAYPVVNMGCDDEPFVVKSPAMPQGIRSETSKSDRELVTAARLGLAFDKAEKFLSDVRVTAAVTAPGEKVDLDRTAVMKVPKYYNRPVEARPKEEENKYKTVVETSSLDVEEIETEELESKQGPPQVTVKVKKQDLGMPRVPSDVSRPFTGATLKHFDSPGRRILGLRGSDVNQDEDLLSARTSLGVRPRLSAWGGNEYNTKRPVIDACSFDLDCVWKRIVNEELADWWLEADVARQNCCCASRASQGPSQCSAFKTRRFIKAGDFIATPSPAVSNKASTAANQWGPLSVLESLTEVQDDDSENWTIANEFRWISDFAKEHSEPLEADSAPKEERTEADGAPKVVDRFSEEVMLDRGISVLASFPGSGNTWVRLLLEYATGYFTGSIYNDLALSSLLPGEGDISSKVLVVKAHTAPESYFSVMKHPASNLTRPLTAVKRVLLLVRHPLDAIWSEFQRRHAGSHVGLATQLRASEFESFSSCMACRWIQYLLKHFQLASELGVSGDQSLSSGVSDRGLRVHVMRYERLKSQHTYLAEMASALSFLGAEVPSPERLGCAGFLAKHSAVHRAKPQAFILKDVYNAIPGLSCRLWNILALNHPAAALLLRLFDYKSYAVEGTCEAQVLRAPCGDVLDGTDLPIQTCAGRQVHNFSPRYDQPPINVDHNIEAGRVPDTTVVAVTAMNAKSEAKEDDEDTEGKLMDPLDEAIELAWAQAIEPLNWRKGESMESVTSRSSEEKKEIVGAVEESTSPELRESPVVTQATVENAPKSSMSTTIIEKFGKCQSREGPLVSVLVSTTSRGVVKKGKTKELSKGQLAERMKWVEDTTLALDLDSLVLFSTMLPSLEATLECGFRYLIVVGFDIGDLYYDSEKTQRLMRSWIDQHIVASANKRNIECSYQLLPVDNPLKKPGPVFNAMAASLSPQVDYIYRVNDDTEFVGGPGWTSKFVRALAAMGGPAFGVVGPSCPQGNRAILTHDFTHRAHIEIFDSYYPEVLTDWFMDDWISRVYGLKRTKLMKDVEVVHHSKTYGRRYDVDGSHRHLVDDLVHAGRDRIGAYMKSNGASEDTVHLFLSDKFDHRQKQKEVDQSTIKSKSKAIRPS